MQITTKRLRLREFVCDDWFDVLAYHRDLRYLRYYPWSQRTESDAQEFVGMFLEQQQEQPRRRFQLVITRLHDGRLIGNCGLRREPDNDWEADIGYELSPDYSGTAGLPAGGLPAPKRILQRPMVGYTPLRLAGG